MVSRSQIGVYASFASMYSADAVSIGPAPASNRRLDAYAIVPGVSDQSGGPSLEISLLRSMSALELALLGVLFLLVSSLVAVRTAEALSERDVELASIPSSLRSKTTTTAAESTGEMERSATDDHQQQRFEYYISPETPSDLLSDEGEVVRLLVANHGRLRQHEIADETDWSKSKVSRICSRMDADGTIEKASVGRENVISLSDRSTDPSAQSDDLENPLP